MSQWEERKRTRQLYKPSHHRVLTDDAYDRVLERAQDAQRRKLPRADEGDSFEEEMETLQRTVRGGKEPFLPTQEEIEMAAASIRSTWTPEEHDRRLGINSDVDLIEVDALPQRRKAVTD